MKKLHVDVWSDIACPWCYVGKRHLEGALDGFAHAAEVEVRWRAFELDPSAPRERDGSLSYVERLAQKYGASRAQAQSMIDRMTETGRSEGLDFRFDRVRSGNTLDAHRVLHLAYERGVQDAVKERLLRAYMTDGELIGDPETLVRVGSEAGLDGEAIRAMLASDALVDEVREDEREARDRGIHGVPFFVVGGRYALSGAQPAALIRKALERAWADLTAAPATLAEGEAAACGPDGCA